MPLIAGSGANYFVRKQRPMALVDAQESSRDVPVSSKLHRVVMHVFQQASLSELREVRVNKFTKEFRQLMWSLEFVTSICGAAL